jgi:hypothetical protein
MPVMPAASQQTMGDQQNRHQPGDQPPLHPLSPLSGICQPTATAERPNHNSQWKPRRDWKFGQFQFGLEPDLVGTMSDPAAIMPGLG